MSSISGKKYCSKPTSQKQTNFHDINEYGHIFKLIFLKFGVQSSQWVQLPVAENCPRPGFPTSAQIISFLLIIAIVFNEIVLKLVFEVRKRLCFRQTLKYEITFTFLILNSILDKIRCWTYSRAKLENIQYLQHKFKLNNYNTANVKYHCPMEYIGSFMLESIP